jgi:hypothetical protein
VEVEDGWVANGVVAIGGISTGCSVGVSTGCSVGVSTGCSVGVSAEGSDLLLRVIGIFLLKLRPGGLSSSSFSGRGRTRGVRLTALSSRPTGWAPRVTRGRPRRRGGVPRGRSAKGGATRQGAKLQGGRSAKGGEAPRGRSATGRWNPLGATERLEATTVTSWSGQTRGGWTMVPAQGPLADGGWCEGWLVDYASTGAPRFIEEDDVRVFCEARGGWAIVPTQGPLGNKNSR